MNKRENIFNILILVVLCLVLFFFHLGARPLWDTDEGMHASTSKDMVSSGDWITPTFNGENFYDKPVLHNWFVSISFLIFGFTEFAARLPAAILGLSGVILTYLLGRKMFGPVVGFLSGAILATNVEYAMLSRTVVHDISLCFFVTLSLFSFYRGFVDERHRKRYFLLFYVSLGFAVLAKGPVGVVLPGSIIGLFLILKKRLAFLREMEIGWGIVIFLVVAAPWYILISLRNRDYGWYFFIYNNLMRYLNPGAQHHQPFYYYFPALLSGFFPWSFFLPYSIFQAFRGPFKKMDEGLLFLLLWVFVTFVFFSAASSKLSTYILPLFPAVSLLVGSLWADPMKTLTPGVRKGFVYSFILLLLILPLVLFFVWIRPPVYYTSKYGIDFLGYSYLVLWIGGGSALSFYLALRKHLKASLWALSGTVVSVFLFVEWAILPTLDPYFTTMGLARKLDQRVPPGEKLVFINSVKDTALFYTHRKALILRTPKEAADFLGSDQRVFCIVNKSLYKDLDKIRRISYIIDEDGGKLIISNRR
jgi:4-amino-4-deoxy-L-arabinose transferase-like glycosyltransferase